MKNAAHYFKLGKDIGFAGLSLDNDDQSSQSWQAKAFREGHRVGVKLRKMQTGYLPNDVPLGGCAKKFPELCRIEHDEGERDCGCAFGQCAKGLIL